MQGGLKINYWTGSVHIWELLRTCFWTWIQMLFDHSEGTKTLFCCEDFFGFFLFFYSEDKRCKLWFSSFFIVIFPCLEYAFSVKLIPNSLLRNYPLFINIFMSQLPKMSRWMLIEILSYLDTCDIFTLSQTCWSL